MDRTVAGVPDSIRVVDEDILLRITGVARSTRRNWARRGLVIDRSDGRYGEADVVETAIVVLLVRATKRLDDAVRLWAAQRDAVLQRALQEPTGELTIVFEPRLLRATLAGTDAEVGRSARPFEPLVAIPLAPKMAEARAAFWQFAAAPRARPDGRRREVREAKRASF